MPSHEWYEPLLRTRAWRIVLGICEDVLIALALLVGLSLIHRILIRTDASEAFKHYFSNLHEWLALCTYTVVGVKGIVRVIRD
jgi:hypothetical protein